MTTRKHKEKPLWQTGRKARKPQGPVVTMQGRRGRQLQRELLAAARAQRAAAEKEMGLQPKSVTARTGAWRFRRHLVPFIWLAIAASGLVFHATGHHGWAGWAAAAVTVGTVICTAGTNTWPMVHSQLSALNAALWLVVFALTGFARPWPAVWLAVWLIFSGLWVDRYRWRIPRTAEPVPGPDTSAQDTFAELAAEHRWAAVLGKGRPIENGMAYPIKTRGTKTHIGKILAEPDAIAASYSASVDRVYAEHHPTGIKDMGELYVLHKSTLEDVCRWSGQGVDPKTGLARVGRWPDGKVVYERVISLPMDGTKHCMIAGADGSGKSALLDQGIASSAITGWIAPVILDPQMGQALPAWRDHVPYACGVGQCMTWLRALKAAMLDRSEYMSTLVWIHPVTGKRRKGMGFFNPFIMVVDPVTGQVRPLGLPVIEITIDEAALLLAEKGAPDLLLDLIKLGRKAGVRIRLATQVPSLSELEKQEIRSLLIGGGAFCLRTGDKVSASMMNVTAAPWELPKIFPNGQQTFGLGYASTLENRPNTPFRADWLEDPWEVAETTKIRGLDDRFAARMAEIIAQEDETAEQLGNAADEVSRLQLRILAELPETQGSLIQAFRGEHSLTEVREAISILEQERKVVRTGDLIEAAP